MSEGGERVLWRVDLHSHTRYSPDSLVEPEALVRRARAVGLNRLAITDHNAIEGALAAHRLAPDLVIVGEEIATETGGELIAYYVHEMVPAGLPVKEAIRRLRDQGAVVGIPHPLDSHRRSALGPKSTAEIIDLVDALEGLNARCLTPADNIAAASLARSHGKLITAGSDAHTLAEVGLAYLIIPSFEPSPQAFMSALAQARPDGRTSGPIPHLSSSYAKMVRRFLGAP